MNNMQILKAVNPGKRAQQGFTIIELVVVILLLGILTATALPRFIDVTEEAYAAAFEGTLGGYATGIGLFHAQYVANGEPGLGTLITGFGASDVPTNATGYPVGAADDAIAADLDCVQVFNFVLQGGRATIAASSTATTTPETSDLIAATTDWIVATQTGTATSCDYAYAVRRGTVSSPGFRYDSLLGNITDLTF